MLTLAARGKAKDPACIDCLQCQPAADQRIEYAVDCHATCIGQLRFKIGMTQWLRCGVKRLKYTHAAMRNPDTCGVQLIDD